MPYLYHLDIVDRMRCSSMFLNGEEKLHATREWKVWAHQELFMLCGSEGMDFFHLGDYENAILSFREAIDTIELFIHREVPDEYRLLGSKTKQALYMLRVAACLYKLGRQEECDDELDRSYSLFCGCFAGDDDPRLKGLLRQYREVYEYMGLSEYKPCI